MEITLEQLKHRFAYHPPKDDDTRHRHESIRATMLDTAEIVLEETGSPSREQSLAITHLEEAMMWANAAIARGPGPAQ